MAPSQPKVTPLKFKGVKHSKVDKKKKKKKALKTIPDSEGVKTKGDAETGDATTEPQHDDAQQADEPSTQTEAERRFEELQERRLMERIARGEKAKTHKQRVEEYNAKLSRLSEHHDMPKIGPG